MTDVISTVWALPDIRFGVAPAIAGFAVAFVAMAVARWWVVRHAREITERAMFDTAITSDDLDILGDYLKNRLGNVTVNAYLTDDMSRIRVNRYVARLSELVDLPPDARSPVKSSVDDALSAAEIPLELHEAWIEPHPDDPQVLRKSIERLQRGETWTALAQLRRDLEKRLRGRYKADHPSKGPLYLAIQDRRVRETTRRFWGIASRAIHGDEVTLEEAAHGVELARTIYRALEDDQTNNMPAADEGFDQ